MGSSWELQSRCQELCQGWEGAKEGSCCAGGGGTCVSLHRIWGWGDMYACGFAIPPLVQALSPPGAELRPALVILSSASPRQLCGEARLCPEGGMGWSRSHSYVSWRPRRAKLGAAREGRSGVQGGWEGVHLGCSLLGGPVALRWATVVPVVVALGRWEAPEAWGLRAPRWCCPGGWG